MEAAVSSPGRVERVRVFIDFWNFQLSANDVSHSKYQPDWMRLPRWLGTEGASTVIGAPVADLRYEGAAIYVSAAPGGSETGLRKWATTFLDRVPGVTVVLKDRVRKQPSVCPSCHQRMDKCCHCATGLSLTEEKGIDVGIATDMIKLAWEDAYDWAVLVSADRDFIPAVEFLNAKGRKVLHAGFPPRGSQLAAKCWGSLNLTPHLQELARTKTAVTTAE